MKPDLTGYVGSEKSHFFFQAEQKERTGTVNSVFFRRASYILPGGGPSLGRDSLTDFMFFSTQKRSKKKTIGGKKKKRGEKHREISNWEHRKSNN